MIDSKPKSQDSIIVKKLVDLYPELLRIAASYTQDTESAQDLLHDAYVKILRRKKSLMNTNLIAYAWKAIRNVYLNKLRDSRRRSVSLFPDFEFTPLNCLSPEELMSAKDSYVSVIAKLPFQFIPTVEKQFLDGKVSTEISEEDDLPLGTVCTRTMRAKKVIRKFLESLDFSVG